MNRQTVSQPLTLLTCRPYFGKQLCVVLLQIQSTLAHCQSAESVQVPHPLSAYPVVTLPTNVKRPTANPHTAIASASRLFFLVSFFIPSPFILNLLRQIEVHNFVLKPGGNLFHIRLRQDTSPHPNRPTQGVKQDRLRSIPEVVAVQGRLIDRSQEAPFIYSVLMQEISRYPGAQTNK